MRETTSLDQSFALIFLVSSIFLVPAVFELLKASENIQNGSLLRGYLLSSIIAVEIIIVTVYGLAVLLNVQWLRFGGIYGLFCVYFKTWLLLSSFLSTKQEDWGNVANPMLNYMINLSCLAIGLIAFRAWQWRSKAKINRSTYFVGIIISCNLFLIFSFLLNLVIFALSGTLTIAVFGITFLIFSDICIVPYIVRRKIPLSRSIIYLSFISFAWSQTWATLLLLLPNIAHILNDNPRIFTFLTGIGLLVSIGMVVAVVFTVLKTYGKIILQFLSLIRQFRPKFHNQKLVSAHFQPPLIKHITNIGGLV